MIEITAWIKDFLRALQDRFGDRVWFVGLQGSYSRGEATDTSDIDMVVILDTLSAEDIGAYNALLDGLPHRELTCGFLSGKQELFRWEPSDLFPLYYDTKPILGNLDEIKPLVDEEAARRAVKLGICNLYHGCVHNMLHHKGEKTLKGLYKMASFVIQAIGFLQTGRYVTRLSELQLLVHPEEQAILDIFSGLKNGRTVDFQEMSEILFAWSQNWIKKI